MFTQTAYLFGSKVLGFGIRLLLPVFLVRIMTKADIGSYNQFFLVEALLMTIFRMGANQSQFYFIPRDRKNAGGIFLNSLLLGLILFTVGYTVAGLFRDQIAEFIGMPILTEYFWYITIYGYLLMLTVTCVTYLTASKRFFQTAVAEIGLQVLASIATLLAAFLTRDLRTILLALIISRGVGLLFLVLYIHFRQDGFRSERYFFNMRKQLKYGIVLGVAGTTWTLLMRMHEFFVSKYFDLETYAVYAQGLKQIPVMQFYAQSISAVALVKFAQLYKSEDWAEVRNFWDRILAGLYGIGIPITLFFVLVAEPLVIFMYTSEYSMAVPIFRWNAIASLFHVLNPTLILRSMDRNDISLKIHGATFIVLPIALYFGMKYFGLLGIISTHAIMLIATRVLNHYVLNQISPIHLPYVPSRKSVWAFYRDSWVKIFEKVEALIKR